MLKSSKIQISISSDLNRKKKNFISLKSNSPSFKDTNAC